MIPTATCTMRLKIFYQSKNKNPIIFYAGAGRFRNIFLTGYTCPDFSRK